MPDMNGYEIISILKNSESTAHIPIIFLTGLLEPESEIKGLSMGAIDYLTKPFSQQLLLKRIEVHLLVEAQKIELKNEKNKLEIAVQDRTKTIVELQNTLLQTIVELVECRDRITGGHLERTRNYLKLLMNLVLEHGLYADELADWDINLFLMSSQLHDVGKITISDSILMKKARLTIEEFEEMKAHTVSGVNLLEKIEKNTEKNDFLSHAKILAGSHHEKWDGTGYPFGLKGPRIPLQGRLMAIVDVYDALTNDRPYKKAFTHQEALEIIKNDMVMHFDPQLLDVFLKHEKEFENIALGNSQNAAWKTPLFDHDRAIRLIEGRRFNGYGRAGDG
jgi:putative two-component system response regulator